VEHDLAERVLLADPVVRGSHDQDAVGVLADHQRRRERPLAWGSVLLARLLLPYWGVGRFALDALLIGAGAWVLGSAIVGFYLLISLNVFGRHSEEAFSALRIQDYKHFLRLHLARDGTMTIYPIAIPRVPRVWGARAKGATGSRIVPQEPFEPVLIEPPIVLRPPPAS
jgi:hypothetical protein